jgi:hypothetical protein
MKTTARIACALFLYAPSALAQVPQVLGVWEFDPQASELPTGFLLASETRSYDLRDDGYLVNVVIRKAPNGHPDFIQIASKSDGKDYPQYQSFLLAEFQINGTKTLFTYSETVLDLVTVMGDYVMVGMVLTAIDQHLPANRPALLPPR